MTHDESALRTLYAISVLKCPMSSSITEVLGETNLRLVSQRLGRLAANGFVEKKLYGKQRIIYMLSLAGRSRLDDLPRRYPKPELAQRRTGANARQAAKPKGTVKEAKPDNIVPPRTFAFPKEVYIPSKHNRDAWRVSL